LPDAQPVLQEHMSVGLAFTSSWFDCLRYWFICLFIDCFIDSL